MRERPGGQATWRREVTSGNGFQITTVAKFEMWYNVDTTCELNIGHVDRPLLF